MISLLAALALTALAAPVAHAGEFQIEGKSLTSLGIASESVEGTITPSNFSVLWLGINFHCTGGKLAGTILLGGTTNLTMQQEGCTVEGSKFCKLFPTKSAMETETQAGTVVASGKGEILLHSGKQYVRFESSAFTTVYMSLSSKGCTLPLEMVASGSFVIAAPSATTPLAEQKFQTIANAEGEELFGVKIACAGQASAIAGAEATIKLVGASNGKKWGFE